MLWYARTGSDCLFDVAMRSPKEIRDDIRAMLDQLSVAAAAHYWEGVRYAEREIRALENELLFTRYKRMDVL